ncbi:MAG: hypothetical protein HY815_26895, partial [Candidatus Riflebacteria bacterium]|nr:hypothetical protein [Candidatus Riflebacteria bacterium]
RKLAGQFRGFAYHLKMLTPALANPRVGLPRRMRVYELLTELWRFDRLHTLRTVKSTEFADQDVSQARASPASSAAALPATAPGTPSPLVSPRALGAAGDRGAAPSPLASADPFVPEDPLAPLGVGAAIQAFMPTEVAVRVPETVQGARALLVVHPNESNLTLSQESSTGDDYLVKGLISPDRKVQRQIAFRATMDRFTEKRIRLSIVGRCLDRRLFVDLVVNGKARLRFFCDRSAMRGVSGLDSYLNLADPVEFEDRVPRQRVSLTVPVELFHHGDNAFVLSAHPLAQVPALYSAACPPAISLVCWNPAP